MRYFDDIAVGDRMELGTHVFTAEDIKRFAAQYDPQAFHMDEAAAAKSHFGALCASGWHTVAVWMNLRVQYGKREDAERSARGEVIAQGRAVARVSRTAVAQAGLRRRHDHLRVRGRGDARHQDAVPAGVSFSRATPAPTRTARLVLSFIGSGFVERRPGRGVDALPLAFGFRSVKTHRPLSGTML